MPQILVEDLKKSFFVSQRSSGFFGSIKGLVQRKTKVVHALKGVSFSLEQGELVGYIGPNGAGKSTTIKILSGILVPSSGKCIIAGRTPWKRIASSPSCSRRSCCSSSAKIYLKMSKWLRSHHKRMKIKTVDRQPPPSLFAPQPAANILRNLLMNASFARTTLRDS